MVDAAVLKVFRNLPRSCEDVNRRGNIPRLVLPGDYAGREKGLESQLLDKVNKWLALVPPAFVVARPQPTLELVVPVEIGTEKHVERDVCCFDSR
jgi:hypothetical protein